MTLYTFTIHTKSGNRIFFYDVDTKLYNLLRDWLDTKKAPYPRNSIQFTYKNPNYTDSKPSTYYFGPSDFVEYYEVSSKKVVK